MIRKLLPYLLVLIIVSTAVGTYWYLYTQRFNQESPTAATQGIFFKKTLNLEAYNHVSSGNDIWGSYDRYSRSDRHSEALTVYCHDFCKKR